MRYVLFAMFAFCSAGCVSFERVEVDQRAPQSSDLRVRCVEEKLLEKREKYNVHAAKRVRVGDVELGRLEFVIQDIEEPPADGIIGANLFMTRRVLLDYEA